MGNPMTDALDWPVEIKVTPEMTAKGVAALWAYSPDYESESQAVLRIFFAMISASPQTLMDRRTQSE